jgi:hypothetical protein
MRVSGFIVFSLRVPDGGGRRILVSLLAGIDE